MKTSAFLIAATHSGAGKTTITLGLIATLKSMGYRVQPFKVGPDFIDTGLHSLVAERTSRNLDPWMCGSDYVRRVFRRSLKGAQVGLIEGVMGVLDGAEASSASVAAMLGVPVVLVVDARSSAESVALPVRGLMEIRRDIKLAGVILNRMGSKRHLELTERAIKKHCGIPVLGCLRADREIEIPGRHLGLYTAEDGWINDDFLERLKEQIKTGIDIKRLLELTTMDFNDEPYGEEAPKKEKQCRIAVARDRAFCFYYEDNLEMLSNQGAELIYFSPLKDSEVPPADALYIGGGYPELYARRLSQNHSMLQSIKDFSEKGGVVYAECGGFMYLTQGIEDDRGRFFKMAGVYPVKTRLKNKRASLGYREVRLKEDAPIGKKGQTMRGHEFHYSELSEKTESLRNIYLGGEGFLKGRTLSSYIHIHFASNPGIPSHLIKTILG